MQLDPTSSIDRPFADANYRFELKFESASDYEKTSGKSLFATLRLALTGEWFAADIREVIRLALIGGGTAPNDALRLVREYVEKRPLAENTVLFTDILTALFFGLDEQEGAKPDGEGR